MIQIIHTPMLAKMRQTFGGKRVRQTHLVLNTNAHLPKFLLIDTAYREKAAIDDLAEHRQNNSDERDNAQEHGAKICLAHA
jgi:hypothetical protein